MLRSLIIYLALGKLIHIDLNIIYVFLAINRSQYKVVSSYPEMVILRLKVDKKAFVTLQALCFELGMGLNLRYRSLKLHYLGTINYLVTLKYISLALFRPLGAVFV